MENDNKSAMDEFLGDLKNDGQSDPFAQNPEDPFAPLEEKKQEGEVMEEGEAEQKVEKPLPFDKDPKIQRYIAKEIAKRIPEQEVREYQEPDTTDIDDVLGRIIGNDTPEKLSAIKDFKRVLLEREDRGAEKAVREWQQEQYAQVQAEQEAEETLLEGFEDIEGQYNIDITSSTPQARKLRGEFINFIRKVAPKDEYGEIADYPDLTQTFDAFSATRQSSNSASKAKQLASRSSERGSGEGTTKPTQRMSFENNDAFEKFKESLA